MNRTIIGNEYINTAKKRKTRTTLAKIAILILEYIACLIRTERFKAYASGVLLLAAVGAIVAAEAGIISLFVGVIICVVLLTTAGSIVAAYRIGENE